MLARLELADEPRLLSILATPLADVAGVKDMLRAIPSSTPRFVDTDDRRELHMTIEIRDGQDNWLGDVRFVWGVRTSNQRVQRRRQQMAKLPAPTEEIVLTHFIVSRNVERSLRFYTDVLGGETMLEGEPSIVALANGWIIINVGGGPTDDKPTVTLEPPSDLDRVSAFLNIRVADIHAVYEAWSRRGAEFLTPPIDRGREIRCYIRDPDGHLIEVGQTTQVAEDRTPA